MSVKVSKMNHCTMFSEVPLKQHVAGIGRENESRSNMHLIICI